jgi:5'(3')-deoxyribonucleotidase
MSKEFTIGVDLDGVVADYESRFREIAAEIMGHDVRRYPPARTWNLVDSGWPFDDNAHYLAVHRQAVAEHGLFRRLAPIPGASEALWRMSDAGIRIRIVTHRLVVNFSHASAVSDTVNWLDDKRIPYRDICFVRDKAEVGADIYVDDSPANVTALREVRGENAVMVYDQLYNRHLPGLRAYNWDDILNEVAARSGLEL